MVFVLEMLEIGSEGPSESLDLILLKIALARNPLAFCVNYNYYVTVD